MGFFKILLPTIIICSVVIACMPYHKTNKYYKKQARLFADTLRQHPLKDRPNTAPYWVGTTNFNLRKPNFVIIHHTAQNGCNETLKAFTLLSSKVSAHYVICKDGTVYHMLNDYLRAWHAGISKWGNLTDVNSSSIGIELDNNGFEPFADPQINSLLLLLDTLKKTYNIPASNFIGHGDIAPTRKNDPNVMFPWKLFSDKGFGLWWDDTAGTKVPGNFDHLQALHSVGYDLKDTIAAIRAFKRHFVQDTTSLNLHEADLKILYSLYKKYL